MNIVIATDIKIPEGFQFSMCKINIFFTQNYVYGSFPGVGKRECFICEKVDGSEDREFVRHPSTSVESNCSDEHADTVDEDASAFGHNKIRKCSFPSCTLRFHENCFLIFTEGHYSNVPCFLLRKCSIFSKEQSNYYHCVTLLHLYALTCTRTKFSGDFLPRIHILDRHGDFCINLKDSKKWICPQHECNFCHQELLRTRAFQGNRFW